MNIAKRGSGARRSVVRNYKKGALLLVIGAGFLGGFVAQTIGVIYQNASAMSGWNWVAESPSHSYRITSAGNLQNKAISADGMTIVYASNLGLKVSHDGGDSWATHHPSTTKYYEYFTGVAVSANGQHIWVEAGYSDDADTFMSNDGGATWSQRGDDTEYQNYCDYLGFVSNDGQVIVCDGVISRDAGATYEYTDYTPYSVSDDLQVMVSDDYISTDTGVTWNQMTTMPAYTNLDWNSSQISSDGQTIAVGTYDTYTSMGSGAITTGYQIALSNDGGATWAMRSVPAIDNAAFKMSRNGQTLYVSNYNDRFGGGDLYVSTDGGQSWQMRNTALPYYNSGYQDFYVSTDGSVLTVFTYSTATFRSEDGGLTWNAHVDRAGVSMVTITEDGSRLYGVVSLGGNTSTNGLLLPVYSDDNAESWQVVYGDLTALPASFTSCTPDKFYGNPSSQYSVSADGQTMVLPGINPTTEADCYLLSKDGGASWQATAGLTNRAIYSKVHISHDGQHLVTKSTSNQTLISHDGGFNWSTIASGYTLAEIQSMSNDGQKIIATTTSDVLLYSTNGGTSWTDIRAVLRAAYAGLNGSDWRASVSGDGSRLVASDAWSSYAYFSVDDGATWTRSQTEISVDGNFNSSYNSWYVGQFAMSEDGMRISAVGGDGIVLTSLDGGYTYGKQDLLEGTNFYTTINTLISADGSALVVLDDEAYFALARYGFSPRPVQGVTTTAGIESVTISWDAPTVVDGSDTVTQQEVRYRVVGQTTWTSASQAISSTATSYTVTGLTPGVQYEFQVRAHNANGGWTPWARAYAPLTVVDISSIVPDGTLDTEYALDFTDDGHIWLAHDYYPCGDPGSCSQNGWMLESSTDGGASWQQNLLPGAVAGVQQSTATPHTLRVSADGQTILVSGTTMYLSRDGGASWTDVTSIGAGRWYTIDISLDGTRMVAAEWGGARQVRLSTDSGATWSVVTLPYGQDSGDVAIMKLLNDGTLYASTWESEQPIVKTLDGGLTWLPASDSMPRSLPTPNTSYAYILDGGIGNLSLVDVSEDGQRMTYVAETGTWSYNGHAIRYVTEDAGQTWTALSPLDDAAAFDEEMLASDDWSYNYAAAFSASGRSAYITGFSPSSSYAIVFSNFSQAFGTPLQASTGAGSEGGAGGAGGAIPGAPNTGVASSFRTSHSTLQANPWGVVLFAVLGAGVGLAGAGAALAVRRFVRSKSDIR